MEYTRFDGRLAVIACALLVSVNALSGQQIEIPSARLRSAADTVRVHAFYEMVNSASRGLGARGGGGLGPRIDLLAAAATRQSDLALELINLLERENVVMKRSAPNILSEAFAAAYYPDLFVTVARMRDPRAVKALIPVIANGDVVQSGIADLGEAAVPDVLQILSTGDDLQKFGAARILGKIASRRAELTISASSMNAIRAGLLVSVRDPNNFILRQTAIESLMPFDNADVRLEMERVAATDTFATTLKDGQRAFPIREAASAWLRAHRKP